MAQNITEIIRAIAEQSMPPYRYWIYTNSGTAGSYTH